jgi:hypothetical protein
VALSNVADLLKGVADVSSNLYNLLIFDWNGATYLPWALGIVGYGILAYAAFTSLKRRFPDLTPRLAVAVSVSPVLLLFALNVTVVGGFGKVPADVWRDPIDRVEARLNSADNGDGYRIDPSSQAAAVQVWTTAQALVAKLQSVNSAHIQLTETQLIQELDFIEKNRNAGLGGWPYFPARTWSVTEISAWVVLANTYALSAPILKNNDVRNRLRTRIVRDVAELLRRQDLNSSGWKPIDETQAAAACTCEKSAPEAASEPRALTRTYSTVMSIWALASARADRQLAGELPKGLDTAISTGVTWLFKNSFDKVGWAPNPVRNDRRESFPGLSAQALFVVDYVSRVESSLIQQPEKLLDAKRTFLGMKALKTNSITENTRIPDADLYLFPTNQVLEGSTFLWFPWSLATLTNLVDDPQLSRDDRREAAKLRSRLLAMAADEQDNIEQAMTYELAESLFCLRYAFRDMPIKRPPPGQNIKG